MPAISVSGVDLDYDVMGDGDPLVLVNGGFLDRGQWALGATDVPPVRS